MKEIFVYQFVKLVTIDTDIQKQASCSCSGSELHLRRTVQHHNVYMLLDMANLPTKQPPKMCVRVGGRLQDTFVAFGLQASNHFGWLRICSWRKAQDIWMLALYHYMYYNRKGITKSYLKFISNLTMWLLLGLKMSRGLLWSNHFCWYLRRDFDIFQIFPFIIENNCKY